MKISVIKANEDQLQELGIKSWPQWGCSPSTFDWEYTESEIAYIISGKVKVKTEWETVEIGPGDLVTFPEGLKCTWTVIEPVKKVYKFN